MAAQLVNGWLVVRYDGPDTATIEMKIGDEKYDAYLDFVGAHRVCKIRPPAGYTPGQTVEVLVNGAHFSIA